MAGILSKQPKTVQIQLAESRLSGQPKFTYRKGRVDIKRSAANLEFTALLVTSGGFEPPTFR